MQRLKDELVAERKRRETLEEEMDLLSFDNLRLRDRVKELEAHLLTIEALLDDPVVPKLENCERLDGEDYSELLADGDGEFARLPRQRFDEVCGGGNVLCAKYLTHHGREYMVCGGVDKVLRCIDLSSREMVISRAFDAPILGIACNGSRVACGMMDGSFAIVRVSLYQVFGLF